MARESLERIVARLYGFQHIVYLDVDIVMHAMKVDLDEAFWGFCKSATDGNIETFVRLLESQGLLKLQEPPVYHLTDER